MERRLNYRHEGKKVKEKPKNIKKTLIRFMPYLKNKYKILFSVFLLVLLSSMLTVIGLYLIGNITNKTFELIKDNSKTYLYNEIVIAGGRRAPHAGPPRGTRRRCRPPGCGLGWEGIRYLATMKCVGEHFSQSVQTCKSRKACKR